jgi:hypothetical protein
MPGNDRREQNAESGKQNAESRDRMRRAENNYRKAECREQNAVDIKKKAESRKQNAECSPSSDSPPTIRRMTTIPGFQKQDIIEM